MTTCPSPPPSLSDLDPCAPPSASDSDILPWIALDDDMTSQLLSDLPELPEMTDCHSFWLGERETPLTVYAEHNNRVQVTEDVLAQKRILAKSIERGLLFTERLSRPFSALATNGTITVSPNGSVRVNRPLYCGQSLGHLFPFGELSALSSPIDTPSSVNAIENVMHGLRYEQHKYYDMHFGCFMTLTSQLSHANCALLDNGWIVTLQDILDVSFESPIELVCYLGTWQKCN